MMVKLIILTRKHSFNWPGQNFLNEYKFKINNKCDTFIRVMTVLQ